MRSALSIIVALLFCSEILGQALPQAPIADPSVGSINKAPLRSEFISYDIRKLAEERDLDELRYYLPLKGNWRVEYVDDYRGSDTMFSRPEFSVAKWAEVKVPSVIDKYTPFREMGASLVAPQLPSKVPCVRYRAEIMVPYLWVDREVFLHVTGVGSAYTLYINGHKAGYSNDDCTPTEHHISPFITDGPNSVCFEVYGYSAGNYLSSNQPSVGSLGEVYVYSQPKLRIADYLIRTTPDSLWRHARLRIDVILANGYNTAEPITVGYDIYGPEGKLRTYNLVDRHLKANSTDTVILEDLIHHAMDRSWSPETPNLYNVMLYVRRAGRIIEYIPLRMGFCKTELRDGVLWHNNREVRLDMVGVNATIDAKNTEAVLRKIKSYGKNTVAPDYPQPLYFYELCDKLGLFVIDQANVNSWYRTDDRNVDGAVVNNPSWLPTIIDRTRTMYERTKNMTCVIGVSLGGLSGNGYNLYKSYLDLKSIDSLNRIRVSYRDLQGEWNRDFDYPAVESVESLFSRPLPAPRKARKTVRRR